MKEMRNEAGGTMLVDLQTDSYNNNIPHHHHHHAGEPRSKPSRPKFGDLLKADHDGIFPSDDLPCPPSIIINTSINPHHPRFSPKQGVDKPRASIDHPRASIDLPRPSIDHPRASIDHPRTSTDLPRFSSASISTMSSGPASGEGSPCVMSPWARVSPPWTSDSNQDTLNQTNGLIGQIVRQEGHIYSLTASGDLLYTGSDSKNIRVWKNLKDYAGFKSSSGLIKAIIIFGDRVFTGHQDGKIRIWKVSKRKPGKHKRVGTLPTFRSIVKSSVNPKHFMESRRNKNGAKTKHYDAVSCLSLNEEVGVLYSSSWDTTIKVWRISDSKCLESIQAHDDAINSVLSGFDDLVFSGSADGTVKVWKRELQGKRTKHSMIQCLLKQENAVTALAVKLKSSIVYCGSSDGVVNYWERSKRVFMGGIMKGHKSAILCLAIAGDLVLSGSADKNICVWRRENDGSHLCLTVLTGHMGPVKCLAVKEEGENREGERRWILYSGSLDKSVKVWRVSERMSTWKDMEDRDDQASGSEMTIVEHRS